MCDSDRRLMHSTKANVEDNSNNKGKLRKDASFDEVIAYEKRQRELESHAEEGSSNK